MLFLKVLHDPTILSDFDVPTLLIVDFNRFQPLGLERTKLDGIINGSLKALGLDSVYGCSVIVNPGEVNHRPDDLRVLFKSLPRGTTFPFLLEVGGRYLAA